MLSLRKANWIRGYSITEAPSFVIRTLSFQLGATGEAKD